MLTHHNLLSNARQVLAWFPDVALGQERVLAVLPFFHVFAMTVVLNMGLACGAELVMLPRFDTEQVLKTIARRKPTLVPGVPTHVQGAAGPSAGRALSDDLDPLLQSAAVRRCRPS